MATTRPQIPVTNLKERIAALEQRNSGINGASRPTSPTPSTLPVNSTTAPGFRDKIAKFERKGGVPVPRGSFGLGAPPPATDGPRRRGELYGNRIPAPARAVSGSVLSATSAARASSPTPTDATGAGLSPTTSLQGDRRSFSLSSVMSEFDESTEYTPVSSPTLTLPPDSPDSQVYTPESSPSLSSLGDIPGFNKHIVRGTSFQKAMEIARNAETSKLENKDFIASISQHSVDSVGATAFEVGTETGLAITVLSEEPTPIGTDHAPTAEHETSASEVKATNEALVATLAEEVSIPEFPLINVTPLEIRKRRPTDPTPPKVNETATDEISIIPTETAPTVVIHAPPAEYADIPTIPIPDQSTVNPTIVLHESDVAKASDATIANVEELPVTTARPEFPPSPEVSAPEIAVEAATTSNELASRNPELILTLNSESFDDSASPLDAGNTSAVSLTEMLGAYFTGKDVNGDATFRPATPPSQPVPSPMSPYATLAYDVPESPEKERIAKPAAIDVPESQSDFLSPPPTAGHRFSAPSSGGSSLGSSSLGSRPMSMIEPASVARAMRMTPATGRGVPMFLPPTSAAPRKSDFAHFPPTPVEEESADFPAPQASMHEATQSLSLPANGGDSVDNFTSVVHDKINEVPTPRRLPQTPQMKRVKHMTSVEPPPSPGYSELAMLLQEAMLLEDSLDRGELPTEARVRMEAEEKQRKAEEVVIAAAEAEARKVQEEEERRRLAAAAERLRAKRDEPTSGRLKHTFLMPLSKARSVHRKEISAPEPETTSYEVHPPKSAGVPEKTSVPSATQLHFSQNGQLLPKTPETASSSQHLETPPKSSKSSRFPSFRRLGGITGATRPNTIHGHSTRNSVSTSSDDSAAVVTPPEGALEFASSRQSNVSEFGGLMANGSTTSFPSLSPKKSASSLGRAASFAERVFSRTRTKSSGSNLSTTSEMTDRIPEDAPTLPTIHIGHLPSTPLASIPDTPAIVLPVSDAETRIFHPPKRSTSLARSSRLPPIPIEYVPPLPAITPTAFFATTAEASDVSGDSFLLPVTTDTARPTSWTSMSSAGSLGSLPSPLFDKDLFDAFPSVPEGTPAVSATASFYPLPRRSVERSNAVIYERPSFDSDLLSSAIHLASTRKSTAPIVPAPASTTSRPTTPVARRSVETVR